MPAALDIDREAVRVLVGAVGVRRAAREMGIPEATVQAWSARGKWCPDEVRAEKERVRAATEMQPHHGPTPAEALANVMSDLDRRSKLGFAKASAKVAEDAADKDVAALLEDAQAVNTWAKTAALAHGWAAAAGNGLTVNTVNILSQAIQL